jgi:hypothetical protein
MFGYTMKTKYTNLVIFTFSLLATESLKIGCFSNFLIFNFTIWQKFRQEKKTLDHMLRCLLPSNCPQNTCQLDLLMLLISQEEDPSTIRLSSF